MARRLKTDWPCSDNRDGTCRLFKLPGLLETLCEDYGQMATYKGTIPGHKHAYDLDDHHRFVTNKPVLV
jgi:arsenite methyltransferase